MGNKKRKSGAIGAPEAATGSDESASGSGRKAKAPRGGSKRQRAEERRRQARRRQLRARAAKIALGSLVILVPALWAFDRGGAEQVVEATVIETQQYPHFNETSGKHTHIRATLLVDGQSEQTLQKADDLVRGQKIKVWVRKGRITGWPYFNDVVKPGELEPEESASS